jgi:hypothetical protein
VKLYLDKQIRYGDDTQHTYISWVYSNRLVAEIHGVHHGKCWRGGKYEVELLEYDYDGTSKELYLLEHNMNQEHGPFSFTIHDNPDSIVSFPIKDLNDFSCFKVTIIDDLVIDDHERDDYEFLLDCDGLLSDEAKAYLREKLIEIVLRLKNELTEE